MVGQQPHAELGVELPERALRHGPRLVHRAGEKSPAPVAAAVVEAVVLAPRLGLGEQFVRPAFDVEPGNAVLHGNH